jgi:hypothetical protein
VRSAADLRSVAVLLAGAGVYAITEGPGGVTFYLTPAFVGAVAVVAGMAGTIRQLVGSGLALIGWGVAALLVHYHQIPAARTAPAYMIGIAAGILAARIVAPETSRSTWMAAAAISGVLGALGYYLDSTTPWLGRWPAWCLVVVAWAIYLAAASLIAQHAKT